MARPSQTPAAQPQSPPSLVLLAIPLGVHTVVGVQSDHHFVALERVACFCCQDSAAPILQILYNLQDAVHPDIGKRCRVFNEVVADSEVDNLLMRHCEAKIQRRGIWVILYVVAHWKLIERGLVRIAQGAGLESGAFCVRRGRHERVAYSPPSALRCPRLQTRSLIHLGMVAHAQ
ncbi:hypothetical protein FA95DRAFT_1047444 [Auriscalpium vulgare]|uniref:Uncharacterized protein n=1 Tax=Auriscalpium vulgare TaxID=40419 RepID=A0ACB8SA10_9AGAM|nr:hypothetical protein FA95DRAFT_1047444 [Auriscalpium vulgare]